jgi:hypothetical protein
MIMTLLWALGRPRSCAHGLCAVCRRPARGFGWYDALRRRDRRPSAQFCSTVCQGYWCRRASRTSAVVDLTEQEQVAIRAAMKPVAEILAEIGWTVRLNELSEAQVLTLIEVAVGGFQDAMHRTARIDDLDVPF